MKSKLLEKNFEAQQNPTEVTGILLAQGHLNLTEMFLYTSKHAYNACA